MNNSCNITSATSPNWEKYSLTFSGVVCQDKPPINILPGSLGISSKLIGVNAEKRPRIQIFSTSNYFLNHFTCGSKHWSLWGWGVGRRSSQTVHGVHVYNSLGGVRGVNFIQYRNLSETEMQDLSSYKTVEIHMVRKKVQHCCNKWCFYRCDLRYSWRTSLAGPSLPQSLMTQEEHLTTFLALPSRSILHRPAHSPSFMLLSTWGQGKNKF